MAIYTKRVQTVLSEAQFKELTKLAAESGKPVSILIREAVEDIYFKKSSAERRKAALANLLTLNAPVADWEQIESEILRGAQE